RQIPHAAADQGRDHATDSPFLDGAEVAVRVAGQPRPGIARHRGVGQPRRGSTSAHHEVVARGDVHPPDLLELVRPDVADVRLTHGRIIQRSDGRQAGVAILSPMMPAMMSATLTSRAVFAGSPSSTIPRFGPWNTESLLYWFIRLLVLSDPASPRAAI